MLMNDYINLKKIVLYQPKFNVQTKEIFSLEALVRFLNYDGKCCNNDVVFKNLKSLKKLKKLTEFVIKRVIGDLKIIYKVLKRYINISINISSKELEAKNFRKWINNLFKNNINLINNIEFEIIEKFSIVNLKKVKEEVYFLKRKGFKVSLDDVGSGFNTFNLPKLLKVNFVKLDRNVIKNIPFRFNFTFDLIKEYHKLNMMVIAEGVEDSTTYKYLKKVKCDYAQGFYFLGAVPLEEIICFL